MRRKLALGMCCIMLAGCQHRYYPQPTISDVRCENRKITIETVPSGAAVYLISGLDGSRTLLGTTPCKEQTVPVVLSLKFKGVSGETMQALQTLPEMVPVSIEKAGYETYVGKLSTERNGKTASHNIALNPKQQ